MLDVLKKSREAVEALESLIQDCPVGVRRNAELRLAWHHMMDAHTLVARGRLTPDDLVWADERVKAIVESE